MTFDSSFVAPRPQLRCCLEAMPTLSELRAKAEELKQSGAAGTHEHRAKKFAGGRAVPADSEDAVLTKLLRFSLHQATALDHVQQGAVTVFVVSHEPMQQKLVEAIQLWDQLLPPQPTPGQWVPHPLGERRCFLFAAMMEQIAALPFAKEVNDSVQYFSAMNLETDMKLALGSFGPRYSTPKAGRPWVFELTISSVAPDSFRLALGKIMSYLQSNKSDLLKVEGMRKGPVGLRQSLWDDLKRLQPMAK